MRRRYSFLWLVWFLVGLMVGLGFMVFVDMFFDIPGWFRERFN